jgi:hypothetical protein
MTYFSWEIRFHISEINFPHQLWKKINFSFNEVDEGHFMHLEKEMISLDPHYFEKIVLDY